jgi:hypothetical protein
LASALQGSVVVSNVHTDAARDSPDERCEEHGRPATSRGVPLGDNLVRLIQRLAVLGVAARRCDGGEDGKDGKESGEDGHLDPSGRPAALVSGKVANVETVTGVSASSGKHERPRQLT